MEDGLINMGGLIEVGDKVFVIAPNDQFTVIHCFILFNYMIFCRVLELHRSKSDGSGCITMSKSRILYVDMGGE